MGSRLGDDDIHRYLLRVYFGPLNNAPVRKAVNRAYLDFSRTQHGFGAHPDRVEVRNSAGRFVQDELTALESAELVCQEKFDTWHEGTCRRLKDCYADFLFTVGQAQKWINMAIKYLFILDRRKVDACWQYCHVPIDNILVEQLRKQGHAPPSINGRWSHLDDYAVYLGFQQWFRREFTGAPMDNEFDLWMRSDTDKALGSD